MLLPDIAAKLALVKEQIALAARRAGRLAADVRLLAVTKAQPAEAVREAALAGHRTFGENYVQEMTGKMDVFADLDIEWHFIGHLQTNKVKYLVGRCALIETVDREKLALEIDRRAAGAGAVQPVLVEVNLGGEEAKSGCPPDEVERLVECVRRLPRVEIRGLMTVPPFLPPQDVRPYFARLREMARRLRDKDILPAAASELSMGMSGDFEAAVEEGSTEVRVGTAIFGPRPQ